MSRIRKLFGNLTPQALRPDNRRREPQRHEPRTLDRKRDPVLATGEWQEIKQRFQGEVRGLVSKSIVESVYVAPLVVTPVDPRDVMQATANRIYADVLYQILSVQATPPFEPGEAILSWSQDALDSALNGWKGDKGSNGSADSGEYEPPMEAKQSTTDAIWEALRQASKNEILETAAKRRVETAP